MNKKLLLAVPVAALGMAGLISGDSFATEGIMDGAALRTCLQDTEQETCVLGGDVTLDATKEHHTSYGGWDSYTDLSVDIKEGHSVYLDLNGHKITANIPINIENGNLAIGNTGDTSGIIAFTNTQKNVRTGATSYEDVKPQFRMVGSSDATKTLYSVLNLNSGVQVTSTENEAVRVSTGTTGYNRYYGTIVNLYGAEINAPKAVVVDDYNGRGQHSKKADNATKVNIGNKTTISTTDDALVSNVFAEWTIDDATIESEKNVISMNNGKVLVQSDNAKLSTEGKGAAVINVKESGSTNEASITIDKGVFQSTGENGVFYKEPRVSGQETIKEISINGGAFTASDLFNAGSRFNHVGFIKGGTWGPEWDEEHDNDFVARGYLKDFDESFGEFSNVMTVTKPSVEGLPEGYSIELSRRVINDDNILKLILEKAGAQGIALNQYIEAYLYDATGVQQSELPDGAEGVTLRIGGFDGIPVKQDGVNRKYYIVSMHYKGEGEDPEILLTEATFDEETGEVTLPNLTKFSNFFIAYEDTPIVTPIAAETATPNTGAGVFGKLGGAVASTLGLFMLAGSTIATYIGVKAYRKKQ